MVADWHALTTQAEKNAETIFENTLEMVLDWLAAGVNPEKAVIYRQSDLPEITQLHLLLSMLTPNKWCETDPTLKDMVQNLSEELSYGLLGYPVLQTADILAVGGTHVPVGQDQLAHLEISRDIVTRFNHTTKSNLFAKPKPMLTQTPLVPGLDGRKMSKSYNNAIILKETAEETTKRLKGAVTDPARKLKTDPGTPENCVAVFPYYKLLADTTTCNTVATECQQAQRGCMDCKMQLAEILNNKLAPIREKRATLDLNNAKSILIAGSENAQKRATPIIKEAKQLLGLASL
jgi:tryptophanyl-tRNA synthetase